MNVIVGCMGHGVKNLAGWVSMYIHGLGVWYSMHLTARFVWPIYHEHGQRPPILPSGDQFNIQLNSIQFNSNSIQIQFKFKYLSMAQEKRKKNTLDANI